MKQRTFFTIAMLTASISVCSAGTITKGVWSPSSCGAEPALPNFKQATVDEYNKSVKTINDWQQKAITYNGCLIKEANADNTLIANSANDEQARLRIAIEKIQAETSAAKAKLDKK